MDGEGHLQWPALAVPVVAPAAALPRPCVLELLSHRVRVTPHGASSEPCTRRVSLPTPWPSAQLSVLLLPHGALLSAPSCSRSLSNVASARAMLGVHDKCGRTCDAHRVFDGMPGWNIVSWNARIAGYMESEKVNFVSSSVIFMYSKTGILDDAKQSFEEADKSSSVPWNSMMFGYAQPGQAQTVYSLFNEMVEQKLDKAKELIDAMPFEPDAMVWMTLLGACRIHGYMELASEVCSYLLVREPRQHSTYIFLSDMYSGLEMWSDRAIVQRAMKNRGLSKVPGWSWIEVNNEMMPRLHGLYDPSKDSSGFTSKVKKDVKHEERRGMQVIMKCSWPKVARLNLVRSPEKELEEPSPPLPPQPQPSDSDGEAADNVEDEETVSIRGPEVMPSCSPESEMPYGNTDDGTSSVSILTDPRASNS
ncbi:hypothetical protein QYE76_070080 [Lolium multiflorum]|uniref:Pentatricopeptide repeat-containing protein n=1 Tax=Lolium multiflorum TaxID=4521 RepID=A0AAD8SJX7_LOLMU|nr:hypothetical protein QYE76_070080 [Lolium multiflorum]